MRLTPPRDPNLSCSAALNLAPEGRRSPTVNSLIRSLMSWSVTWGGYTYIVYTGSGKLSAWIYGDIVGCLRFEFVQDRYVSKLKRLCRIDVPQNCSTELGVRMGSVWVRPGDGWMRAAALPSSVGCFSSTNNGLRAGLFSWVFKKIQRILYSLCMAAGPGSWSGAQGSRPVGRHPMGSGPLALTDLFQGDVESVACVESA